VETVFFKQTSAEDAAAMLKYARSTIYYRIDRLLKMIAEVVNEGV